VFRPLNDERPYREVLDIQINGDLKWAYIVTDSKLTFPIDIQGNAIALSIDT